MFYVRPRLPAKPIAGKVRRRSVAFRRSDGVTPLGPGALRLTTMKGITWTGSIVRASGTGAGTNQ
jgi:hypothetical protein